MELRQLEYFLAVVEEGSFTRAAGRLYMVQSSLSAALLGLERELGAQLFVRGHRGATLTDAGRALVEPARAALADVDRARDAVAEITGLLRGAVRVATVAVPRAVDLFDCVRRFREEHPHVQVHVLHAGARDLHELVMDGAVDFAISPLNGRPRAALRFEHLLSSPLAVLCATDHRLAGAPSVSLGEIVDEPLIDLPRGWWSRDVVEAMFAEQGLPRGASLEVDEWFGVLGLVERDIGVSYGPRACVDEELFPRVCPVPLVSAPTWEVGIVTREDGPRGAAGRAFLEAYRARVRAGAAGG